MYDVDAIVDHRPCTIAGQYEYKVHWAGYASTEDSWETADSVAHCSDLGTTGETLHDTDAINIPASSSDFVHRPKLHYFMRDYFTTL